MIGSPNKYKKAGQEEIPAGQLQLEGDWEVVFRENPEKRQLPKGLPDGTPTHMFGPDVLLVGWIEDLRIARAGAVSRRLASTNRPAGPSWPGMDRLAGLTDVLRGRHDADRCAVFWRDVVDVIGRGGESCLSRHVLGYDRRLARALLADVAAARS